MDAVRSAKAAYLDGINFDMEGPVKVIDQSGVRHEACHK